MNFTMIPMMAALSLFANAETSELAVAVFQADVTPPIGSPIDIGLDRAKKIVNPLTARGIVFFTDESPVVLCAVDWVGIGNTAHDEWRETLAEAAGTTADRVSVHVLHQHDAPGVDFLAEEILAEYGFSGIMFDPAAAREALARTAEAVRLSLDDRQQVTHVGIGKGKVEIAYSQGGYEPGDWSWVAPEVEGVLMDAMRELLEADSQ